MKLRLEILFSLLFLLFCTPAVAAIIAQSDFDNGTDGWTWLSADPGISWQSSGGNPDGYIRYDNNVPYGPDATASIYAPQTYLGDWSGMGVTDLTYEANIFQTGSYARIGRYRVTINGPGGEYRWDGPPPAPSIPWLQLDVPVAESEWTLVSGDWNDLLADVTELSITMAYYTNFTPFEITGIDNVTLNAVPIPTTLFLFGSVLIGLTGFRRKIKLN